MRDPAMWMRMAEVTVRLKGEGLTTDVESMYRLGARDLNAYFGGNNGKHNEWVAE